MKIKLLDQNLGEQPGLSPFISPKYNFERDLADPDLLICTDHMCYSSDLSVYSCPKIAWLIEPPIINGENHTKMVHSLAYKNFDFVFTYNRWLEDMIPNFVFHPHAGTWLREGDLGIHKKTHLCSMIFSDKDWNASHKQRKRAFDLASTKNIDCSFFGSGANNPIEFKSEGLSDFMFSIAMENEAPPYLFSPKTDYFSEKVIDCFLSGTIPIYYGNPSISKYFNEEGILIFTDVDQLPDILDNLSPELYQSKEKAIAENFEIAERYMTPEDLIVEKFNDLTK